MVVVLCLVVGIVEPGQSCEVIVKRSRLSRIRPVVFALAAVTVIDDAANLLESDALQLLLHTNELPGPSPGAEFWQLQLDSRLCC